VRKRVAAVAQTEHDHLHDDEKPHALADDAAR